MGGSYLFVVEQGQQFFSMVQVIFGDLVKVEFVEVVQCDGGEGELGGSYFIEFGDVVVVEVVLYMFSVYIQQYSQ